MKNFKFKCLVSDRDNFEKPGKDLISRGITYNNKFNDFNKELNIDELKEYVAKGRCFSFGDWETTTERLEKHLKGRNLIWLDFDGAYKLEDIKEVISKLQFYVYLATSSSHQKKGLDKFKLFIPLNQYLRKEDFKYNVEQLVKELGCVFEKHIMNRVDGKKKIVSQGVDPASKKYNQICFGFCYDKTNRPHFYEYENNSDNLRAAIFENKEIVERKEKVKKQKEKRTSKIKVIGTDLFYSYELHKQFINGNQELFNEEGTYHNLFEVASNYSKADKEEEFKELVEQYPRRTFSALKSRFGKGNDSYYSTDFLEYIENNQRIRMFKYETEYLPDYFFFEPLKIDTETDGGNVIIKARTGAGKTTALLSFIKKLRGESQNDINYRHIIVAVSYTHIRANETSLHLV